MKSLLYVILVFGLIGPAVAQKKDEVKNTDGAMDEMMKKWMAMATPNENHKIMDDMVGSWETTNTMWMEGPDKPPTVTKGTSEMRWVLGGRFLEQEVKGEMMGGPFEGMGLTGYDNMNKMYVSFWADNSSTAFYTSEGTYDPAAKKFTFFGPMDDPITDQHGKTARYVITMANKDKIIWEFYDESQPAGRTKMGEMVYVRKAAAGKAVKQ